MPTPPPPAPPSAEGRIVAPSIYSPASNVAIAVSNQVEFKWSEVVGSNGYLIRVDDITNNTRTRIYSNDYYLTTSYQVPVVVGRTYDVWVHSKRHDFDYENLDSYSVATHRIFTVNNGTGSPVPTSTPTSTCIGDTTQTCSVTNGSGSKTRTCLANNIWSAWSNCSLSTCNNGYVPSGNGCILPGSARMTVGPAELIMNNFDTGNHMDMSPPTLRKSATEFYTWTENSDWQFKKFSGNLNNPFQDLIWSDVRRWNFTGFPTVGQHRYRPWMANIYKHTDGTLIGLVHIETSDLSDYNGYLFRQGIGISTDNGDHWRYLGDVIKPQYDAFSNLGGTPLLIVGEYFYQYYNEIPLPQNGVASPRIPAVARAKISDVVTAAKQGQVSPWTKYNNGNWNQDGLTGVGSNILPHPDRYDMHTDAVYSTSLGKYLLIAWEQRGYVYQDEPDTGRKFGETYQGNKGLYLYTSTDGVHWGDRKKIYTPTDSREENPYAFFAGLGAGSSEDFNILGGDFYLYFPDRINHKLYRIPFTFP